MVDLQYSFGIGMDFMQKDRNGQDDLVYDSMAGLIPGLVPRVIVDGVRC